MEYSILIQWSDEDRVYIASLPEWGDTAHVHGETQEEALENARTAIRELEWGYKQVNKPLPSPNKK